MASSSPSSTSQDANRKRVLESVDCWLTNDVIQEEFTVHWTIGNYDSGSNTLVTSKFFFGPKSEHAWRLHAMPKHEIDAELYFSIALELVGAANNIPDVTVTVEVSILDKNDEECYTLGGSQVMKEGESVGWNNFILAEHLNEDVLCDGHLRLLIRLKIGPGFGEFNVKRPRTEAYEGRVNPAPVSEPLPVTTEPKPPSSTKVATETNLPTNSPVSSECVPSTRTELSTDIEQVFSEKVETEEAKSGAPSDSEVMKPVTNHEVSTEILSIASTELSNEASPPVSPTRVDDLDTKSASETLTPSTTTMTQSTLHKSLSLSPLNSGDDDEISSAARYVATCYMRDDDLSEADLKTYALDLFKLAMKLRMKTTELRNRAEHVLISSLTVENAAKIFAVARTYDEGGKLERSTVEFMQSHREVEVTPEFQTALQMDPELTNFLWSDPQPDYYS